MTSRSESADPLTDVETLRALGESPELVEEVVSSTQSELTLQERLRDRYPKELVRAAFQLVELRDRARRKFQNADAMWFDRQGLEQSTAEAVAEHKAQRFAAVSGSIADWCCGIGADAIAMARHCDVRAVDLSPAACLMTDWNAAACGCASRLETEVADVTSIETVPDYVHIDPDRRAGRQRAIRLEDYAPSLEFLQDLRERCDGGAIKLSPASNFGGKFPGCEVELVSLDGECKEATVWFGALHSGAEWRATVLPAGESLTGDPWTAYAERSGLREYVYEPDPSVVRAGLVDVLAESTGLARLDDAEEYLTSSTHCRSPFVVGFEVVASCPNNDKQIRKMVRDAHLASIEIKCRHVPVKVEALRRKLPLAGEGSGVLIFARVTGRTRAVLARRIPSVQENRSAR